ncbi:hypothetical protein RND81_07G004800 [Saponaria officinalis]|uniref:Uncharacterized protein n=1 Tax=Saponaria officinalis TaxID=3572 RepID=A0AAW1JLL4_SAPOF
MFPSSRYIFYDVVSRRNFLLHVNKLIGVFNALNWVKGRSKSTPQAFLFSAAAQPCFLVTDLSSDEQKSTIDDIYKFEYHIHELNTHKVTDGLVNLRRVLKQASSFFFKVKSCGFRHNVETYMSVIEILCSSGSSTMLEAVWSEVIKSKNEIGFDSSELLEALFEKLVHEGTRFLLRASVCVGTQVFTPQNKPCDESGHAC